MSIHSVNETYNSYSKELFKPDSLISIKDLTDIIRLSLKSIDKIRGYALFQKGFNRSVVQVREVVIQSLPAHLTEAGNFNPAAMDCARSRVVLDVVDPAEGEHLASLKNYPD